MHEKTRNLLEELIEFFEGCGRNRIKTINYFARATKKSPDTIRKLLGRYEKKGISILETRTKPRLTFNCTALPIAKKVLELLKEDPSISQNEGAQIVGISQVYFGILKKDLLTPGRLTTEKKIQLGLIPPPQADSPDVNLKVEESNAEDVDVGMDSGDDDGEALTDLRFENCTVKCKTEPELSTTSLESTRGNRRRRFRYCLLCFIRIDSENEASQKVTRSRSRRGNPSITIPRSSMANDGDGDGQLGENLNVIFALKNIFCLESPDLIKFMKASKGKDPRGWYHLCSECDGIMKEAVAIQRQVLQLTRELEYCKSRIREKVKDSCGKGLDRFKTGDVNDDHLVTKLIRESVCPRKQRNRKLRKSGAAGEGVEVKREPVDEDDYEPTGDFGDSENETFLSDSVEHEISPGILTGTTGEIVSSAEDVNVNQNPPPPFMEPELSSIIGINESGAHLRDLKFKPKLVICELCGEKVRRFSLPVHTLRLHDVLMEGYTEYKCLESGCQYKTVIKRNFRDHMNHVHLPLKYGRKFSCQVCGKKFKCNSHLRNHMEIHENAGTTPYQCEICGRGFAVRATLWSHTKVVHQGWVSPFRKRLMDRKKKLTETVSTHPQENNVRVPPLPEQLTSTSNPQGHQEQQNNFERESSSNVSSSLHQTFSSFTSL